jgi:hypothetical protein
MTASQWILAIVGFLVLGHQLLRTLARGVTLPTDHIEAAAEFYMERSRRQFPLTEEVRRYWQLRITRQKRLRGEIILDDYNIQFLKGVTA